MSQTKTPLEHDAFMQALAARVGEQPEYLQAVSEVMHSVLPFVRENPSYQVEGLLWEIVEPDRIVSFKVPWFDDKGEMQVNRGWRVGFSNVLGPYKGGLRFHPTVNESVLKFLGFEQQFKNALTQLPMGGGKGGSNFNPRGRSDGEIRRFCQAFMLELHPYIGSQVDVPAGDIGVGGREIGYLYRTYKKIVGQVDPAITGKSPGTGGSLLRPEATGFGCVYFLEEMLKRHQKGLEGQTCVVSGAGNVALHAAQLAMDKGARVLSVSDSGGTLYIPEGMTAELLEAVKELKEVKRGRLSELSKDARVEYREGQKPWAIPAKIALPCATQNEILAEDAKAMVTNGCIAVAEGANMPSTNRAIDCFLENKVCFGPGKAANAGGVSVSGFEQSQNAQRMYWSKAQVQQKLQEMMKNIHSACEAGVDTPAGQVVNYVQGANISGFRRVADAVLSLGWP